MRNRGMALIVVFPALLGLVACGGKKDGDGVASAGGSASASASATADATDAQLKFAQCMRENGVNVPDPSSGKGVRLQDTGADPAKVEAATKKCQPLLQGGGQIAPPNDPKAQDQMLKFAQCMREHGVKIKDPKPGSGGGMLQGGEGGSPEKLQAAQKACQSLLPGGGPK
ncbi:hypothetical protein [Actinomadura sp. DC4]|uniref:hypothetical protein n=1 Tax=Actinomadura sp. DC4 TaxID=3055069 RepID=UPI0025B0CBFE|nr:hypothetical protein [Actinomadura sp. DC4]MDN3356459.1 hypothetical protein [Actinomadura sp. DC4]